MYKLLQNLLAWHAKRILTKYKPIIIGITGSVGKTSTKEAIFSVVSKKYDARRNIKNYNNELGLPLTIIGGLAGGRNPLKWLSVFLKAWALILFKRPYPEMLVLEMGADRPGDIGHLTKIAPPDVGVVTAVGDLSPVHVEFFEGKEGVIKEKAQMVRALRKNGYAVLNVDDAPVAGMAKKTKANVVLVGFSKQAQIQATDVQLFQKFSDDIDKVEVGSSFKLHHKGTVVPVFLPHVLGQHQMYAALLAAAVGILYEINLVEISEALRSFDAPPGRMHLIKGIKNTLLIDDSYNSSPIASHAAVEVLASANVKGRKIAAFGTMGELGAHTKKAHADLGKWIVKHKIDYLITVGVGGRLVANAAQKAGMNEDRVTEFETSAEAGRFIQELMKEGDLVLIKGSQSSRMEKIALEVMAEPMRAAELLVRQGPDWK